MINIHGKKVGVFTVLEDLVFEYEDIRNLINLHIKLYKSKKLKGFIFKNCTVVNVPNEGILVNKNRKYYFCGVEIDTKTCVFFGWRCFNKNIIIS